MRAHCENATRWPIPGGQRKVTRVLYPSAPISAAQSRPRPDGRRRRVVAFEVRAQEAAFKLADALA